MRTSPSPSPSSASSITVGGPGIRSSPERLVSCPCSPITVPSSPTEPAWNEWSPELGSFSSPTRPLRPEAGAFSDVRSAQRLPAPVSFAQLNAVQHSLKRSASFEWPQFKIEDEGDWWHPSYSKSRRLSALGAHSEEQDMKFINFCESAVVA